ncbi:MAG: hypothetical protein HPY66_0764 [Firmicutes bacterium]|nr:hypothetical protein [Bacillota bacterium]
MDMPPGMERRGTGYVYCQKPLPKFHEAVFMFYASRTIASMG